MFKSGFQVTQSTLIRSFAIYRDQLRSIAISKFQSTFQLGAVCIQIFQINTS